jgi:hypothetical protein
MRYYFFGAVRTQRVGRRQGKYCFANIRWLPPTTHALCNLAFFRTPVSLSSPASRSRKTARISQWMRRGRWRWYVALFVVFALVFEQRRLLLLSLLSLLLLLSVVVVVILLFVVIVVCYCLLMLFLPLQKHIFVACCCCCRYSRLLFFVVVLFFLTLQKAGRRTGRACAD